ncbi:hypothetical protein SAMD00019534_114950, partial [Acytostelium subglobosum LB1]|uniref:hypothetical protein n=1 Tax=Acytostelium subglobosum LB1 TaxID=1410327 RepID=UPI000644C501
YNTYLFMEAIMDKSEKEIIDLQKEILDIEKNQTAIKEKGVSFKEQINVGFRHLDDICNTLAKQEKESSRLQARLAALPKSKESAELAAKLSGLRASIRQSKKTFTPETGGMFVRLFLGQVNVKHYREGERFRLKTEYEKFRFKTNPQFLGFVALLLLFPYSSFVTTSWQIWLLYYYVTLALRENILLVNGSSIRPWWIMHHYLSIAGSLTNLLWPFSDSFAYFLPQMTYFSGAQGLVQFLASRYQQGQLYKLTAMGKATIMDVSGENNKQIQGHGWAPSALFLLPFLLFVQSFQLYNGITFLYYCFTHQGIEWQVIACGIIFILLGVGNFITTMQTYYSKWLNKKQKKS